MRRAIRQGKALLALVPVIGALLVAGCDGNAGAQDNSRVLRVFAAASLTEAFEEAATVFEDDHPGADVLLNVAGSTALATQIEEGAPADVFVSADVAQMERLEGAGHVGAPQLFATNRLVLVVPHGAETVRTFADLAQDGVRLVIAGAHVPAGRYAREVLRKASGAPGLEGFEARVLANVRSEEANVRAVLAKVQLGEADAGFVYATDLPAARGEVDHVEIPEEFAVPAQYPAAVVSESAEPELAAAFIEFLLSPAGQRLLIERGFGGHSQ